MHLKGAPRVVFNQCTQIIDGKEIRGITKEDIDLVESQVEKMGKKLVPLGIVDWLSIILMSSVIGRLDYFKDKAEKLIKISDEPFLIDNVQLTIKNTNHLKSRYR